jgi:hypothetical protein
MNDIKVKFKNEVKPLEAHTYSLCDIRHPLAKKLETSIEETVVHYRHAVGSAKRDLYGVLARDGDTEEVNTLKAVIQEIKRRGHLELTEMYAALRDISLVNLVTVKNILPTEGRAVVAAWIIGDNTFDAATGANYGSLGTDNTAPANGDTTLGTETYRKATSSATSSSNVSFLSNFYTAAEVTGTFEEAGWHIDGTGSVDTGELLSHFLTGSIVKSSIETLTVESQITVT